MAQLEESQQTQRPALIHCVPEMFWDGTIAGSVDSEFAKTVDLAAVDAYRFNYRYWRRKGPWPPSTKWIVDRGANKEPSLILLTPDGSTKNIKGFHYDHNEIIDFLELERKRPNRQPLLLGFLVLSGLLTALIISWRRYRQPPDNNALHEQPD